MAMCHHISTYLILSLQVDSVGPQSPTEPVDVNLNGVQVVIVLTPQNEDEPVGVNTVELVVCGEPGKILLLDLNFYIALYINAHLS